MEIACDILKKSCPTSKYIDIKKDFINLKLNVITKKDTMDTFLKLVNNKNYITIATRLLGEYFHNIDTNMGTSILMAYCISSFSDTLFSSYKTRFEQKLILSANKVVIYINKLVNNNSVTEDFTHEFLNIIDHYYSLYKIWKSKDSINEMSDLFENIQTTTNVLKYQIKKNKSITSIASITSNISNKSNILPINYDSLTDSLEKLFYLNAKYALRIILHNYDIFNELSSFEIKFWEKVKMLYPKYKDAMFIILVVELKIRLIQRLSDPSDRKDIYYKLDTENIIDKIRSGTLTNSKIIKIINMLQNKMSKINDNFICKELTNSQDIDIIDIFSVMFNYSIVNLYHVKTSE